MSKIHCNLSARHSLGKHQCRLIVKAKTTFSFAAWAMWSSNNLFLVRITFEEKFEHSRTAIGLAKLNLKYLSSLADALILDKLCYELLRWLREMAEEWWVDYESSDESLLNSMKFLRLHRPTQLRQTAGMQLLLLPIHQEQEPTVGCLKTRTSDRLQQTVSMYDTFQYFTVSKSIHVFSNYLSLDNYVDAR